MDVFKLNSSTYLPEDLIEGYDSMIWSERFTPSGDFKMRSSKIEETRTLIPEGSLISHHESSEVMIVESHLIQKDEKGNASLTTSGRTFDTFLENREVSGVEGPWVDPTSRFIQRQYTPAEVSALLAYVDVVAYPEFPMGSPPGPENLIPNLAVTISSALSGVETQAWTLDSGQTHERLVEYLEAGDLGLKTIRPPSYGAPIATFDYEGTLTITGTGITDKMRLDIYQGFDRTVNQSENPPVLFHYALGDIEEPSYLFSNHNFKNVAYVDIGAGGLYVYLPWVNPSVSGLNRRLLYVDAKNISGEGLSETLLQRKVQQRGRRELRKNNRANPRTLFDGKIAATSESKYGVNYFLGDKVSLIAEYGVNLSMYVTEYVRTEDAEGDRGFPTLSLDI